MIRSICLLGALTGGVHAQAATVAINTSRLALRTDTFDVSMQSNFESRPRKYTAVLVESLRRTTDRRGAALTEIRMTKQYDERGKLYLTIADTTRMDAATLRLLRKRFVLTVATGLTILDKTATAADDGAIAFRALVDSGQKRDRPGRQLRTQAVGSPHLALRSIPLTGAVPPPFSSIRMASDTVDVVHVDSAVRHETAGRVTWEVHASVVGEGAITLTLDDVSRDLMRIVTARTDGAFSSVAINRRYRNSLPSAGSMSATRSGDTVAAAAGGERAGYAGRYVLVGQRESAAELRLNANGRFQFALTYGAIDETGAGRWRVTNGSIILDSDGEPTPPRVRLLSSSGAARDSLRIVVVDTTGQPIRGIELTTVSKDGSYRFEKSRVDGNAYALRPDGPPIELQAGLDMFNFQSRIQLPSPLPAELRLEFNPGTLSTRHFRNQVLAIDGRNLRTTLNDVRLRFERQ